MARPGVGGYFRQLSSRARAGGARFRSRRSGAPPPGRSGAPVTIEYTPKIDGDPDPGEVVWTWVPFEEDPNQGKDRPVIVIGRRGTHLVGVPLTSKQHGDEAQVSVGTGGWDPQHRVSYARIWRMLEIDPSEMRREGSVLAKDRFDAVAAAVDHYYDVTYAPSAVNPPPARRRFRGAARQAPAST